MRKIIGEILLISLIFFPPNIFLPANLFKADFAYLAYNYLIVSIPQIFLLIYLLGLQNQSLANFGIVSFKALMFAKGLFLACFCLFLLFLFSFLISVLPKEYFDYLYKPYNFKLKNLAELTLALPFCLATGYREELFFRSYFNLRLQEVGLPLWLTFFSSTLFFALLHLTQGWLAVVFSFLLGSVFFYYFNRKREIHSIALAHGLYNFSLLAILYFQQLS